MEQKLKTSEGMSLALARNFEAKKIASSFN